MSENETSQHLRSMDVLKGIIVVIIVIGHLLLLSRGGDGGGGGGGGGGLVGGGMPVIVQSLYLGLMGFLILSGYFYRPRGFKTNMGKRLKQIAVPLAIASLLLPLILWIYLNVLGYDLPIDKYLAGVLSNVGLNYTGVSAAELYINYGPYFLAGMLWGFLIFYAIAQYILDDWRITMVMIVLLLLLQIAMVECIKGELIPRPPMMMWLGPINAAFMFTGALLAKKQVLEKIEYGNKKSLKYWLIPIVCLAAGVGLCYFFPPGIGYDKLSYGEYGTASLFPYYIESLLNFIFIAYLGFIFSKIPLVSRLFDSFGHHTLGVILLHASVGKILVAAFGFTVTSAIIPSTVPMPMSLVITVLTLAICLILCYLIPLVLARIKRTKGTQQTA